MIYTTYFGRVKDLPKDIVPIAICGKSPDWWTGAEYKKLAPKYAFFSKWKETHNNEYYIIRFFLDVLMQLNVQDVVTDLIKIAKDKKIALVCYEKPMDFCHRHIVREWLRSYGYETEEYQYDTQNQVE